MHILVTGAAGFIGYHVSQALARRGDTVVALDNLNDYYDPRLKQARLQQLTEVASAQLRFVQADLCDRASLIELFKAERFDAVINLAAQAGVRYSLQNPDAYVQSNLQGFLGILECCRHHPVQHLVYASSSSVYGMNSRMPFSVSDTVDHPVSLYAATKKANELMAHTYSHLYGIATTGLRFFTVYGPWGRPDMAYFLFTRAILAGEPIRVFNEGRMQRDFTYIDDIVEGVVRVLDKPATADTRWSGDAPDPASSSAPYRLFNIGNHQPVSLLAFIETLERLLGREANKVFAPMQSGDVEATYADIDALREWVGWAPHTDLETGLARFLDWYRDFYSTDHSTDKGQTA